MARRIGSHGVITGPRVRKAAERLFARFGYAAVSMRGIAAEVGVSAGALYQYTPDKQSLLAELMASHLEELLPALEAALAPADPDPVAQLNAFVRFHIDHHLARRDAVFIAYMELRSLTPENFARVSALRSAYEARLEAVISAGITAAVFRPQDSRLATRALIAMMTGVTTWYRDDGPLTPAELAQTYAALALQALR